MLAGWELLVTSGVILQTIIAQSFGIGGAEVFFGRSKRCSV